MEAILAVFQLIFYHWRLLPSFLWWGVEACWQWMLLFAALLWHVHASRDCHRVVAILPDIFLLVVDLRFGVVIKLDRGGCRATRWCGTRRIWILHKTRLIDLEYRSINDVTNVRRGYMNFKNNCECVISSSPTFVYSCYTWGPPGQWMIRGIQFSNPPSPPLRHPNCLHIPPESFCSLSLPLPCSSIPRTLLHFNTKGTMIRLHLYPRLTRTERRNDHNLLCSLSFLILSAQKWTSAS